MTLLLTAPPVHTVMESGNGLLSQDLSSYGSDASLTPPSGSTSLTSSPPRGTLTPEQRELKRQRDQARRDSKLVARNRRADSTSSYVHSPPVHMADLTTAASSMPIYTTAPSQISLLAEPASTLAPQQYLPSFSPPMPDHTQSGLFSSPYSTASYMPVDYSSSYPPTTHAMPAHYG
jgi:hypothetical protein